MTQENGGSRVGGRLHQAAPTVQADRAEGEGGCKEPQDGGGQARGGGEGHRADALLRCPVLRGREALRRGQRGVQGQGLQASSITFQTYHRELPSDLPGPHRGGPALRPVAPGPGQGPGVRPPADEEHDHQRQGGRGAGEVRAWLQHRQGALREGGPAGEPHRGRGVRRCPVQGPVPRGSEGGHRLGAFAAGSGEAGFGGGALQGVVAGDR